MKQIGKKELKEFIAIASEYGVELTKKDKIMKKDEFYLLNNEVIFFGYDGKILPTLRTLYSHPESKSNLKKITVDMGAVRFVVNGADIMRPGISTFDAGLRQDEAVLIIDEKNKKCLAIGAMNYSDHDMHNEKGGKAVKNLHYFGDNIFKNEI